MPKYSFCRYSRLASWLLVVVFLHGTPMWSLAQEAPIEEAMKKWREYEAFSHNLQGKFHYQVTNMITGETTSNFSVCYRQNQKCALICSSYGKITDGEYVMMTNPDYSAEIKKSQGNPNDVVLRAYVPETNATLPHTAIPIVDQVFAETSPHFTYEGRSRLSDVISSSSFRVEKISKETVDGQELVRIDHRYVYYWDPPSYKDRRQNHVRGSIFLDPAHCWCVKRIQKTQQVLLNGVEDETAEIVIQYETRDSISGFPILKRQTRDATGYSQRRKQKFKNQFEYDYELEVNDHLPDSDFMLSAFGLPEPIGVSVKQPIPAYIWILAAAGLCAFLAFGFRYLARRKHQTPMA